MPRCGVFYLEHKSSQYWMFAFEADDLTKGLKALTLVREALGAEGSMLVVNGHKEGDQWPSQLVKREPQRPAAQEALLIARKRSYLEKCVYQPQLSHIL